MVYTGTKKIITKYRKRIDKKSIKQCAGIPVTRRELGLPDDWRIIEGWCAGTGAQFQLRDAQKKKKEEKNWGISNFETPVGPGFWKEFPSRELPKKPTTKIFTAVLAHRIAKAKPGWTIHQNYTAASAYSSLTEGARAYQATPLPEAILRNAPSIYKHSNTFTNTLTEWIEKGFVAGPFLLPPVANFRANVLMAEEQKDKVRPILNLSSPEGESFNDNVEKILMPKTYQSSARLFGQTLLAVGPGAVMSKMDMRDAFKLVPAKIADLRLQGFRWLGAFFIDTQQIFGGSPSVSNFDQVAETVLNIVLSETKINKHQVHRTLDDVACVAQPATGHCQEFTAAYRRVCGELGVPLADDCPLKEKAFSNESQGTVLGVEFNTNRLEWRLHPRKIADIVAAIELMQQSGHSDLKQMEKLTGKLNNFAQMMPFAKLFKRTMNQFLASFAENYEILLEVPEHFKKDLDIWKSILTCSPDWLPIARDGQSSSGCPEIRVGCGRWHRERGLGRRSVDW